MKKLQHFKVGNFLILTLFFFMAGLMVKAQDLPELIYFKFDDPSSSTVINHADPDTRPFDVADVIGGADIGGSGQFGTALLGDGNSSSGVYYDWQHTIDHDFTISLWMNNILTSGSRYAGFAYPDIHDNFRLWLSGTNMYLRGTGMGNHGALTIPSQGPHVFTFTVNAGSGEMNIYIDGQHVMTDNVGTPNVGIDGFIIGGFRSLTANSADIDEFRFYSRELSAQEVAETWNIELGIDEGPPEARFHSPDSTWTNTNVRFYNHSKYADSYSWFVDGIFETDDEHYLFSRANPGTYEIELETSNDIGTDRTSRTIRVVEPTGRPRADFFTSDNVVPINTPVSFFDVSTQGPHTWNWTITPETRTLDPILPPQGAYDFDNNLDEESQTPLVNFILPGSYDVELTVENTYDLDGSATPGVGNILKEDYIQVAYFMCPQFVDQTVSNESQGALTDDQGDDPYDESDNCGFLIEPCVDDLFITFDHFELECGTAYLRIWDGVDETGVPLHGETNGFTGGGDQDGCDPGDVLLPPERLESETGRFYIEFEAPGNSDGLRGFQLRWNSVEKNQPPTAMFDALDTVCVGAAVDFQNMTTGSGVEGYAWDYQGSGTIQDSTSEGRYRFNIPDVYSTTLYAYDCAGLVDTFRRDIVVIDPSDPANVEIHVSNENPWVREDQVQLSAEYSGCISEFEWEISPGNYRFVEGTNAQSREPIVEFTRPGCFDVTFRAQNPAGETVVTESCAIEVRDYCDPIVGQAIQDIGTSYIRIADQEFVRSTGEEIYADLTDGQEVNLEKGGTYTLTIDRPSIANPMDRAVWIDYSQDGGFDGPDEMIGFESNARTSRYTTTFTVPGHAVEGLTRLRIGTGMGGSNPQPCGGHSIGEYIDISVYIGPDEIPPVITLDGNNPYHLEVFNNFQEPGYSAEDNADGDLTSAVVIDDSELDIETLGTYEVYYTVSDQSGNETTVIREVVVEDTENPEITLVEDDTLTFEVHSDFDDPGVDITDNYWEDLEATVSTNLNMSRLGTYTVEYCVTDLSGNGPVCVNRNVRVVDTTPPEIIFPAETLRTEVNEQFEMPDPEVRDNYWSTDDIYVEVLERLEVPTTLGVYEVRVMAVDGSGNSTTETLYVISEDTTPPEVSLKGRKNVNISKFEVYNDPGLNVSDNFDPTPRIITGGDFEGASRSGFYTRTYYAVDQSGNASEVLVRNFFVSNDIMSLEEAEGGTEVNIYPNPARDVININTSQIRGEYSILLMDASGRELKTLSPDNQSAIQEMDLSGFSSGVYIVSVRTGSEVLNKRITLLK